MGQLWTDESTRQCRQCKKVLGLSVRGKNCASCRTVNAAERVATKLEVARRAEAAASMVIGDSAGVYEGSTEGQDEPLRKKGRSFSSSPWSAASITVSPSGAFVANGISNTGWQSTARQGDGQVMIQPFAVDASMLDGHALGTILDLPSPRKRIRMENSEGHTRPAAAPMISASASMPPPPLPASFTPPVLVQHRRSPAPASSSTPVSALSATSTPLASTLITRSSAPRGISISTSASARRASSFTPIVPTSSRSEPSIPRSQSTAISPQAVIGNHRAAMELPHISRFRTASQPYLPTQPQPSATRPGPSMAPPATLPSSANTGTRHVLQHHVSPLNSLAAAAAWRARLPHYDPSGMLYPGVFRSLPATDVEFIPLKASDSTGKGKGKAVDGRGQGEDLLVRIGRDVMSVAKTLRTGVGSAASHHQVINLTNTPDTGLGTYGLTNRSSIAKFSHKDVPVGYTLPSPKVKLKRKQKDKKQVDTATPVDTQDEKKRTSFPNGVCATPSCTNTVYRWMPAKRCVECTMHGLSALDVDKHAESYLGAPVDTTKDSFEHYLKNGSALAAPKVVFSPAVSSLVPEEIAKGCDSDLSDLTPSEDSLDDDDASTQVPSGLKIRIPARNGFVGTAPTPTPCTRCAAPALGARKQCEGCRQIFRDYRKMRAQGEPIPAGFLALKKGVGPAYVPGTEHSGLLILNTEGAHDINGEWDAGGSRMAESREEGKGKAKKRVRIQKRHIEPPYQTMGKMIEALKAGLDDFVMAQAAYLKTYEGPSKRALEGNGRNSDDVDMENVLGQEVPPDGAGLGHRDIQSTSDGRSDQATSTAIPATLVAVPKSSATALDHGTRMMVIDGEHLPLSSKSTLSLRPVVQPALAVTSPQPISAEPSLASTVIMEPSSPFSAATLIAPTALVSELKDIPPSPSFSDYLIWPDEGEGTDVSVKALPSTETSATMDIPSIALASAPISAPASTPTPTPTSIPILDSIAEETSVTPVLMATPQPTVLAPPSSQPLYASLQTAYGFSGECSVVLGPPPYADYDGARIDEVLKALEKALGMTFVERERTKAVGGGIVLRLACLHEVPVPVLIPGIEAASQSLPQQGTVTVPVISSEMPNLQRTNIFEGALSTPSVTVPASHDVPHITTLTPSLSTHGLEPTTGSQAEPRPGLFTVVSKRMRGDLEVSVGQDRSHKRLPGQRTIVRFTLVG